MSTTASTYAMMVVLEEKENKKGKISSLVFDHVPEAE